MKHALLAATIVLLCPLAANADYWPTHLVEMIGVADRIAVGTIVKLGQHTYELQVEDQLAGSGTVGETIVVEQFHDWMCARRRVGYATGQRVLVFLKTSIYSPARYAIIGAGCEGESLVVDDLVRVNFRCPCTPLAAESGYVSRESLRAAIVDFRATYRVTPTAARFVMTDLGPTYPMFDRIETIVTPAESPAQGGFRKRYPLGSKVVPTSFERRSAIHKFLYDELAAERKRILRSRHLSGT